MSWRPLDKRRTAPDTLRASIFARPSQELLHHPREAHVTREGTMERADTVRCAWSRCRPSVNVDAPGTYHRWACGSQGDEDDVGR